MTCSRTCNGWPAQSLLNGMPNSPCWLEAQNNGEWVWMSDFASSTKLRHPADVPLGWVGAMTTQPYEKSADCRVVMQALGGQRVFGQIGASQFLREEEGIEVSPKTLQKRRCVGGGPLFFKGP